MKKSHLATAQMRNKEGKAWELWKQGICRYLQKLDKEKA